MAERAQHVEAGTAPRTDFWLTIGGEDKVVACGETVTFEPDRFGAVISSLEASPLLVELLCSPREPGDFVARLWRRLIGHRSAV